MSLIYMQETITHIIDNHMDRMGELNALGEPEPVELMDENGNVKTKYYIFK